MNTKDFLYLKVYRNMTFDLQLQQLTNLFSTKNIVCNLPRAQPLSYRPAAHYWILLDFLYISIGRYEMSSYWYQPICFFPYRNSSNQMDTLDNKRYAFHKSAWTLAERTSLAWYAVERHGMVRYMVCSQRCSILCSNKLWCLILCSGLDVWPN